MIPNAWLISAIAVLGALVSGFFYGGHVREEQVRGEYSARDLQTAIETSAQIKGITTRYRTQENGWAEAFGKVDLKLSQEVQKHAKTKDDLRAALKSGAVVLRDPGNNQASGNCAAKTTSSTSGSNGSQGRELSGELAEFLTSEASRADEVVSQLAACQGILKAERR